MANQQTAGSDGTSDDPSRRTNPRGPIEKGPNTERVAANIRYFRELRGLSPQQVSELAAALGHHIHQSSIYKLETGARRVDVDDLVALSLVLGVTPNLLLLRDEQAPGDSAGEVQFTPMRRVPALDAWRWATGAAPLPGDATPAGRFRAENRPYAKSSVPMQWVSKHLGLLQRSQEVFRDAAKDGVAPQVLVAMWEMTDIDVAEDGATKGARDHAD